MFLISVRLCDGPLGRSFLEWEWDSPPWELGNHLVQISIYDKDADASVADGYYLFMLL